MAVPGEDPDKSAQRQPVETAPPRIAPLPYLPLFHNLVGRKVVVAGATQGTLWKAELLAAAGAEVSVLAGDGPGAALFDSLASAPPAGAIHVEPRGWRPDDLNGAALAVADLGDPDEAARFAAVAHDCGVPVNVVDRTDACDVIFGTIVNRSPAVIAISSGGGAPMLGQSIRARIESVVPRGLSAWAEAARAWRPWLKEQLKEFADRRAYWERFTRFAWANAGRAPTEDDRNILLEAERSPAGRVILVGAGPGDPELLTLKAIAALQSATVILYDSLVSERILELARREARRIAVGKKGHGPSCRQSDINRQIVELAQAGETVVRLKGGDPLIFGRATEEVEACRAAGVSVELIPGISAAQGAAAALGFSLTERHVARRVQFVTGHGADGKLPEDIDWSAIADPLATTVIYMPRATLEQFVARAVKQGLAPNTPAAAIASATEPGQQQVFGEMADLPTLAAGLDPDSPMIIILGQVLDHSIRGHTNLQA
jgi:uroporphyrin-III C-methyltransferase/precorrin-2 dehydrogenase/sirohydrochlorin ferrochelatase